MSARVNYESFEDGALVAAAQRGDLEAFEELVRRHSQYVYGRAFAFLRDEDAALDVSQDAWVRAWRSLRKFKGDCAFTTWMTRIVTNLCIDKVRQMRRDRGYSIEGLEEEIGGVERLLPPIEVDPIKGLAVEEQKAIVERALAKLSEVHRMVIILHEFDNMSYKEIARVMRCSIGTVMSRLYYARRYFAKAVRELLESGQ